jgi:hypothetical protein
MGRGQSKLRQRDVTRIAKGLTVAGQQLDRVVYDNTTNQTTFIFKDGTSTTANEWDNYVNEQHAKAAKVAKT